MKPWMVLTALTALLVLAGIWLVWSQSPDVEAPVEPEEEVAVVDFVPAPVAAPAPPVRTIHPEPEKALEDWDKQLAQACKNLIRSRKYEEAQQCYQLRLARNPEEPAVYMERGILHARMGKRIEAYWDYQKYLELEPYGPKAPQIRSILEQYDEWASGSRVPKRSKYDYKGEILRMAKRLYEEAYIIKNSNPKEALRKLQLALKLLPDEEQTYRDKIDRLTKRIESGPEEPPHQHPRPEDF